MRPIIWKKWRMSENEQAKRRHIASRERAGDFVGSDFDVVGKMLRMRSGVGRSRLHPAVDEY